jgi:RNA polymerase sigma factor (sigma-70 family)
MAHDNKAEWIAEVLARYEAPLLRFAARLLRDGDRARDTVQETFLQLCQQDRPAVEGHLAAWLFRVCRNRALDLRRKETRMETFEHDTDAADPNAGPSEQAASREDAGNIMKILETLPEAQQEAVYLRFQGGLSYKEIAEVTGHTVTNVGFLLHAAVKSIRARLATDNAAPAARTAEGSR